MHIVRLFALCAALAASALPVEAAEPHAPRAWKCWHSADGTTKNAVPMPLIQEGDALHIQGAEFIEYSILHDNDVGIVAIRSYAEADASTKHLGADVLVIDRATLDFRKGNVFADGARVDNLVRRGRCSPSD